MSCENWGGGGGGEGGGLIPSEARFYSGSIRTYMASPKF